MTNFESKDENITFLLKVLSDHIHNRKTDIAYICDDDFFEIVDTQQVSPIVYYQCGIEKLKTAFTSATYFTINREKQIETLESLFFQENIKYLIFKGPEVAKFYHKPFLRTYGDVDILVSEPDKEKAGELIEKCGFKNVNEKEDNHEWIYFKGKYEIELHHKLLYECELNEKESVALMDKVWEHSTTENGIKYHIEPEFHFVFLLLHIRKHLLRSGVGIRQFIDLAMVIKNANLNFNVVNQYIKDVNLYQFSKVCLSLIDYWFSVKSDITDVCLDNEFYKSATDMVFADSVYGYLGGCNEIDDIIIEKTINKGKLRTIFMYLFPPYEIIAEKYTDIKKFKYGRLFLPIYWIKRIAGYIFGKKRMKTSDYVERHLNIIDKERIKRPFLRKWGL